MACAQDTLHITRILWPMWWKMIGSVKNENKNVEVIDCNV